MKKLNFIAVLALIITACNQDDNNDKVLAEPIFEEQKLLKGWSYETILYRDTLYAYHHNPDCYRDYFGFRNNQGQIYQFEDTYYTNTYCTNNTIVMRWEPVGNHINFYFGKTKVDQFEVISVTDSLFTFGIDRDIDQNGSNEHLIITAIPYDPYHSFGNRTSQIPNDTSRNRKSFPFLLNQQNQQRYYTE